MTDLPTDPVAAVRDLPALLRRADRVDWSVARETWRTRDHTCLSVDQEHHEVCATVDNRTGKVVSVRIAMDEPTAQTCASLADVVRDASEVQFHEGGADHEHVAFMGGMTLHVLHEATTGIVERVLASAPVHVVPGPSVPVGEVVDVLRRAAAR